MWLKRVGRLRRQDVFGLFGLQPGSPSHSSDGSGP